MYSADLLRHFVHCVPISNTCVLYVQYMGVRICILLQSSNRYPFSALDNNSAEKKNMEELLMDLLFQYVRLLHWTVSILGDPDLGNLSVQFFYSFQ